MTRWPEGGARGKVKLCPKWNGFILSPFYVRLNCVYADGGSLNRNGTTNIQSRFHDCYFSYGLIILFKLNPDPIGVP